MQNRSLSRKAALAANKYVKEGEYWLNKFSGDLKITRFPYDYSSPLPAGEKKDPVEIKFNTGCVAKLVEISKGRDQRLYIILTAILAALLNKYSGNNDIVIGTPIFKTGIEGDFVNTVLALRIPLHDSMTFKELLLQQVRPAILEAHENRNYPIEALMYQLNIPFSTRGFPLFDVVILLENIHEKKYIRDIQANMVFSFLTYGQDLVGKVEYNTSLYRRDTIERLSCHFRRFLENVIFNVEIPISEICILGEEERRQLLWEFNDTAADYPAHQTIDQLFEQQAFRLPDKVALVYKSDHLTHRALSEKSSGLAAYLLAKGVKPGESLAVMVDKSRIVITAILAVLKAGGAYLPLNFHYPEARKKYILDDCGVRFLLTNFRKSCDYNLRLINLEDIENRDISGVPLQMERFVSTRSGKNLAYIMYTSGSTGRPKGVMVEHRSVLRLVKNTNYIEFRESDRILLTGALEFDASTFEIWGALLNGSVLHLEDRETVLSHNQLKQAITRNKITMIWMTSSFFNQAVDAEPGMFAGIRTLLVGGDVVSPNHINRVKKHYPGIAIINGYGPTENTTFSLTHRIDCEYRHNIPIGKPIANSTAYILDHHGGLVPTGVRGELYVGGVGLARGYLNNPELTYEKFINQKFLSTTETQNNQKLLRGVQGGGFLEKSPPGRRRQKLYKTGDLARWLHAGTIEFLGRMDQQVKIRGYRIEPGEIENHLMSLREIDEAVVITGDAGEGEKYLCAYVVAGNRAGEKSGRLDISNIKRTLSGYLPDYMVPAYFVQLEKIPLTFNGKVDRKLLPEPETLSSHTDYEPPRNLVEEKLVGIWSPVLNLSRERIGINADFFELGGHSLRATALISRIHSELKVRVPLAELFKSPTIRELGEYIRGLAPDPLASLVIVEKKDYYRLSSAQKRLYVLQQLESAGIGYNVPRAVILEGKLDKDRLANIFRKLIQRHESLRTSFHISENNPVQRIHDRIEFEIESFEKEDHDLSMGIHHWFIRPFDLSQAPLLRVALIKITGEEHLLIVDMHHIVTDGVSLDLFIKEFGAYYVGEELLPIKYQYKDFAEWQANELQEKAITEQERFWLKQFTHEVPVLNLPFDYPRPVVQSFEGDSISFEIPGELAGQLNRLALKTGTTMFMVLLAVYYVLLSRLSGQEDIVVGTPIAARRHVDLERIIGMFVNTLALRNYPHGDIRFIDFLGEVKKRTLEAFENQEYPFENLVEHAWVPVRRDAGRNPLFDTVFAWQNMEARAINITENISANGIPGLTVKPYENKTFTAKFDISLICGPDRDGISCVWEYCTRLFSKETIKRYTGYFKNILSSVADFPGQEIGEIEILTEEERNRLLFDFNNTDVSYPQDKTFAQLFSEQVEMFPDQVAINGRGLSKAGKNNVQITYRELNSSSARLSRHLQARGVNADTIVGIMAERSLELFIGILGILKAGGAYLPIDPLYPQERIQYMLNDSGARIKLIGKDLTSWLSPGQGEQRDLSLSGRNFIQSTPGDVPVHAQLAYVLYTSGTTGKPKGILIEHRSLLNLCHWHLRYYEVTEKDRAGQYANLTFDASVLEIFPPLVRGISLHIIPEQIKPDIEKLKDFIEKNKITIVFLPTQFCQHFMVEAGDCKSLRLIFTGGEQLRKMVKRNYGLYNNYGPTENTVVTTVFAVEENRDLIPIGKPIDNNRVYILNPGNLRLQPFGVTGELCVSGNNLSRGYLNKPGLTSKKFINYKLKMTNTNKATGNVNNKKFLPGVQGGGFYKKSPPGRRRQNIYKTGDLAQWLADGNIQFLGRMDQQVKIRGYRIEFGEIENRILKHPAVSETAVITGEDKNHQSFLCAYIRLKSGETMPELQEYLSGWLPQYMIPSYIVPIDSFPLNQSGKVDKKALPEPWTAISRKNRVPPQNLIEEQLIDIWAEVLGIEKHMIGIEDDFFQLGGHSLKATILAARIHKQFQVKIPLMEIFKTPCINKLAGYIGSPVPGKKVYVPIVPCEKKEYYALSPTQKRLYVLHQLIPASTGYNVPQAIPLGKGADLEKLEQAFKKLLARHDSLRTSFQMIDGIPVQRVRDTVEFKIFDYDSERSDENYKLQNTNYKQIANSKLQITSREMVHHSFIMPFELSRAPLLRVALTKTDSSQFLLMIDLHHIITDGSSQGILEQEFLTLYAGKELAPLRLQYKDFSEWQNSEKQKKIINRQEAYWLKEFSRDDELPVLNLPFDYPRPLLQDFEGNVVQFFLGSQETKIVKNTADNNDITLYMCLLALLNIMLFKLSGQEDITVGTPIAARRHVDLQGIIGMLVNTLAMRNYPTAHKTLAEFLKEVKQRTLDAYENQEYPFEQLVEKLSILRDTSRNPVFDVMLNLLNQSDTHWQLPAGGIHDQSPHEHQPGVSRFDLVFNVIDRGEHIHFIMEYSSRLFTPQTIERFIRYLKNIVMSLSLPLARQQRLVDIDMIPVEEKKEILQICHGVREGAEHVKTIHQWFEQQVEKTPHHMALVGPKLQDTPAHLYSITYSQLNKKADQLAQLLGEKGIRPGDLAAVMVDRSIEMIIGILGILKSGAAYLPIDPGYPEQRISTMLSDSGAAILLTQAKFLETFSIPAFNRKLAGQEILSEIEIPRTAKKRKIRQIILLERMGEHFPLKPLNTRQFHQDNQLLYVIYTSGSSGKPKGVLLEHKNLANLIRFQFDYTHIDFSRVLQFTTISFDVSAQEIFSTLLAGGRLYLVNKEILTDIPALFRLVDVHHIKTLFLPASFLKFVMNEEEYSKRIPPGLAHIVTAGEQVIINEKFKEYLKRNRVCFHNHYGPSETHVVTTFTMKPGEYIPGLPPIGRPVANTSIHILDKGMHLVPPGVSGELFIGGIQVGRGYLNNPDLTAEMFCLFSPGRLFSRKPPPWTPRKSFLLIYRTGDLARILSDGNIEFLGRIDFQVKIRGFRIELGEIENRLLNYPGSKEAVVLLRSVSAESNDKYLCAYMIADPEPVESELREYLAKNVPEYMIPTYFVMLEQIPLTPNRKIDRRQLPTPGIKQGEKYTAPRNEVEKELVRIWAEVLGGEATHLVATAEFPLIGIDDNFFELGGHSLRAALLAAKIHKKLDVKLPLAEIFKTPTIRGLSQYIRKAVKEKFLSVYPSEKKEYYAVSSAQKRLYFLQQMGKKSTAYNMPNILYLEEPPELERIEQTFRRLIQRHEGLRTSFHMHDLQPVQQVQEKNEQFHITIYNRMPDPQLQVTAVIKDFIQPFDLSQAPLLRVGVIIPPRLLPGNSSHDCGYQYKYLLLVDMHHIISDGVTFTMLVKEFARMYMNPRQRLPLLRLQYRDFSQWRDSWAGKEAMKSAENYWLHRFQGEIPVLKLPTDYARPGIQSFDGRCIDFCLDAALTERMRSIASSTGVTLFMLLLALFNVLLANVCGQEDIIVGTGTEGRRHEDLRWIVGIFVNTLALRNYPQPDQDFKEFLEQLKDSTLAAFENQEYPFEELVEKLNDSGRLLRDTSRNPLFDVMFQFNNFEIPEVEIPILKAKPYRYERQVAKFDLTLWAYERKEQLHFSFEYALKLFKPETIHLFIRYFKEIATAVVANPNQKLHEIRQIPEETKKKLLGQLNQGIEAGITRMKESIQILQHRLLNVMEKFPDNIAIESGTNALSYGKLEKRSALLAEHIIEKGTFIGVLMNDRMTLCCIAVAIWRAGGVFVPLDPASPKNRLELMIDSTGLELVFVDQPGYHALAGSMSQWQGKVELFLIDDENGDIENLSNYPHQPRHISYKADDKIYIYFTSGTTGTPKAIMGKNVSLVHCIDWELETFVIDETFRCSQLITPGFDAFLREILVPFCCGGTVCIPEKKDTLFDGRALLKWLERSRIHLINCVPGVFRLFAFLPLTRENLTHLRVILFSGERIRSSDLKKWFAIFADRVRLVNLWGTTETTLFKTYHIIRETDLELERIPVGKPINGAAVLVLDQNRQICEPLVTGELYILTPFRSFGYHGDRTLTAMKFIRNPFNNSDNDPDDLLFKTGDLGRILADGTIDLLGRNDRQVKIRGIRIELEEIENVLLNHPDIKEAVVIKKELSHQNELLCAYVTAKPGNNHKDKGELFIREVKAYLTDNLPAYMVPVRIMEIEEIPRTINRKIDYKKLSELSTEPERTVAPRNIIEQKLAALWSDILNKENISATDNFFTLGGNSLNAMPLISRIHREFAVRIPLADIFTHATIEKLAVLVTGMQNERYFSIEAAEKKEYYSLSSAQKRLYILYQLQKEATAYNMFRIIPIPLSNDVDVLKLKEIARKLIRRHESLRTSFHMVDGDGVQKIHPHDRVDFDIEQFEPDTYTIEPGGIIRENYKIQIPDKDETQSSHSYHSSIALQRSFIRPFDLSRAPLLRLGLIRQPNPGGSCRGMYLLMVDMHHIISDGVSQDILLKDFMALLHGEDLSPLRIDCKDFSQWQNSRLESERIKQQVSYWLKQFPGEIPVLELPVDYPRPSIQDFSGSAYRFTVGSHDTLALKKIAAKENATLFMVLFGLFYILLAKLSGQEDIIVGIPTAGRRHTDLEQVIGMFVNTLAVRNFPGVQRSFSGFLEELKNRTLESLENQDYPFENLVECVAVKRDLSHHPLFDVMFAMQHITDNENDNEDENEAVHENGNENFIGNNNSSTQMDMEQKIREWDTGISRFDLTLHCQETNNRLHFTFEYSSKLFKKDTINRFSRYFRQAISGLLAHTDRNICEIDIIPDEEKRQILWDFNQTQTSYPEDKTIHHLFQEQVKKTPHAPALVYDNHLVTYSELNRIANHLACILRQKILKPDTIVAIMAAPCIEVIFGILGILKTGAAYLPIDPGCPSNRLNYMIADSSSQVLLTRKKWIPAIKHTCEIISLEDHHPYRTLSNPRIGNIKDVNIKSNHLVYVIYTSGTTGNPKGVLVQHRSLINSCHWYNEYYNVTPEDRAFQYANFGFDASVLEIFPYLIAGASIYIPTDDIKMNLHRLNDFFEMNQISIGFLPTQFCQQFMEISNRSLRVLLTAGDQLRKFIKRNYRLANNYGPTENTVVSTAFIVDKQYSNIPIGKPISNTRIYILGKGNELKPIGIPGELCIIGVGLARGYMNRPELTSSRFKTYNKKFLRGSRGQFLQKEPPGRRRQKLYKTGDLARWQTQGTIEFLGRIDHQVKIRGFRVELGEIENRLLKHPFVEKAIALVKEKKENDSYLYAYILINRKTLKKFHTPDSIIQQLKEFLSGFLPYYMIPDYIIQVEEFPLTLNGKIDRHRLPEPEHIGSSTAFVGPGNPMEKKLTEIWSKILGIEKEKIGIDTNFFELGGHSLKATLLISQLYRTFNVNVPLTEVFKTPTIRALAKYIKEMQTIYSPSSPQSQYPDHNLVLLKQKPGNTDHLFFIHDGTGEVEGYIEFCNRLIIDVNCWGIRADRIKNYSPGNLTIKDMAKNYIETIKKVQPPGHEPYSITGWSLGGAIAFEIALQMETMGDKISFLGLIDAPAPQTDRYLKMNPFTLESELDWLGIYLPDKQIMKKTRNVSDINEIWPLIINHLEENNVKPDKVKTLIPPGLARIIPDFNRLSTRELIYYLNAGRTLTRALGSYIPSKKIQTRVFYFKAGESPGIAQESWKAYCLNPIKSYEIPGDHYSILKKPAVIYLSTLVASHVKKVPTSCV